MPSTPIYRLQQECFTEPAAVKEEEILQANAKERLPKGHSDLVAYKDGKAYFLEVKTDAGRIRPEQKKFIAVMRDRYGCAAGIVRSVDDALELVGAV